MIELFGMQVPVTLEVYPAGVGRVCESRLVRCDRCGAPIRTTTDILVVLVSPDAHLRSKYGIDLGVSTERVHRSIAFHMALCLPVQVSEVEVRGPGVPEGKRGLMVLQTKSGFIFRVSQETLNRYKQDYGLDADWRLQIFAEALGDHYTVLRSHQDQVGQIVV